MNFLINKNFLKILNKKDLTKVFLFSFLHFLGSLFDLLSFGLIVPVLYMVNDEKYLNYFNEIVFLPKISLENDQLNFLLYLLIILFFINLIKITYLIFLNYLKNKFAYNLRKSNSIKIFSNFLSFDYSYFVKTNSSKIIRTALTDVDNFISLYMMPFLEIISDLFLLFVLTLISLYFQPEITLIIFFFISLYLFIVLKFLSKKGYDYGILRNELYTKSFKILQESIGAIKEIKIFNAKNYFVKLFDKNYSNFINYALKNTLIVELPRFFIEIFLFIILIFIVLFLISKEVTLLSILTNIGVFSIISIRLIPVLTKLQSNFQNIQNNTIAGEEIIKVININSNKTVNNKFSKSNLNLNNSIVFNNVDFIYPENKNKTLNNINFEICKSDVVGLVGDSGSGKTTLINIILDLLKPSSGEIYIEKNHISYVPQSIYLTDDSVKNNIAFGISSGVNEKKIWNLLKMFDLDSVIKTLPNGIDSHVGERGVSLSGGQIQRMGIARALYFNPKILILDEATNALDEKVEKKTLNSIVDYKKELTIILITHGNQGLKYCNKIYKIENGKLLKTN